MFCNIRYFGDEFDLCFGILCIYIAPQNVKNPFEKTCPKSGGAFSPKFFSRFARQNSDYDLRAKSNARVPNR